jgi:hypothetical protein
MKIILFTTITRVTIYYCFNAAPSIRVNSIGISFLLLKLKNKLSFIYIWVYRKYGLYLHGLRIAVMLHVFKDKNSSFYTGKRDSNLAYQAALTGYIKEKAGTFAAHKLIAYTYLIFNLCPAQMMNTFTNSK